MYTDRGCECLWLHFAHLLTGTGPINSHRKTVHVPGQNDEEYTLEEPQGDYNILHLEWRLWKSWYLFIQ